MRQTIPTPEETLTAMPQFSWDLVADWQTIFQYPFMQNAFLAGTMVAIVAGVVGYFVVVRHLAFASHTLANIGFAGAAGAVVIGIPPVAGLLAFTFAGALGIGAFSREVGNRDVITGTVLVWCLGLGTLFLSLYSGYATNAYGILFGEILGITRQDVWLTLVAAVITLGAMAIIYRPLLFASLDQEVAEARGVPVRFLSIAFLLIMAVAVAVAVQVVGVLLIFSLIITPAAIAERLTQRPPIAVLLAVVLALGFTWGGLVAGFYLPYPVSVYITSLAFGTYLVVRLAHWGWQQWTQRHVNARRHEVLA